MYAYVYMHVIRSLCVCVCMSYVRTYLHVRTCVGRQVEGYMAEYVVAHVMA